MTQAQLADLADEMEVHFAVVTNFDGYRVKVRLENASTVTLPGGKGDWRLYFCSIRKITATTSAGLAVQHVQGSLHMIAPTEGFGGLPPGTSLEIVYSTNYCSIAYSDFMPRAFIFWPGLDPEVVANTDTEDATHYVDPIVTPRQQLRNNHPDLFPIATAQSRFLANEPIAGVKLDKREALRRIIPSPLIIHYGDGQTVIDKTWRIRYAGRLTTEAKYLQSALDRIIGANLAAQPDHIASHAPTIHLVVDAEFTPEELGGRLGPEGYLLAVEANGIRIIGGGNAGAFYGIQSLLDLLPANGDEAVTVSELIAIDQPRAGWRGMHYDMARNFHGKDVTLRLIEQMARYKLNRFHMHLTDDEGWRLEIPGLPELTDVGAHRCFDLQEDTCLLTMLGTGPHETGSGNGYYTRRDFIEILEFAAERHIEVIPEIDMPGHARAAIKSMEARYRRLLGRGERTEAQRYLLSDPLDTSRYSSIQFYTDNSINVCLPSTYAFVDKIMYELQQMYREAGVSLTTFHFGGDEVGQGSWTGSPACQELVATVQGVAGVADLKPYFVSKVAELASHRGLSLAGWEDGLMYDQTTTFRRAQFDNETVIANVWDNIWEWGAADRAYRLANSGYKVILSPATHLYLNHAQEAHPAERGYYWASRFTDAKKVFGFMPDALYANADLTIDGRPIDDLEALVGRELPALEQPDNILGIQGQVWTETIRTGKQLEQMLYPRLLALAERAWHKASWEGIGPDSSARTQDWASFASTLAQKELPRLAAAGVSFRLPPPGARRHDGVLQANATYPGLTIEYSVDDGKTWVTYSSPVTTEARSLAVRTRCGDAVSRTTTVSRSDEANSLLEE